MPKVSGIFATFKDVDLIPLNNILAWLPQALNIYSIENYVANLILYPQTVPNTEQELDIELAFLREILKKNPGYLDDKNKRINIPEEFSIRFPEITKLAWAFIDAYKPLGIYELVLVKKSYSITLGSAIIPVFNHKEGDGMMDFVFAKKPNPSAQQIYNVKQNTLLVVPCVFPKISVNFKSKEATILNQKESMLEVSGGEIGIIIDGRGKDESNSK